MKNKFREFHKQNLLLQVLIILILTLVIFFAAYYQPGKCCSIYFLSA